MRLQIQFNVAAGVGHSSVGQASRRSPFLQTYSRSRSGLFRSSGAAHASRRELQGQRQARRLSYGIALNNSSAPLRLSQFSLHAAAETFRANDGGFVLAAHWSSPTRPTRPRIISDASAPCREAASRQKAANFFLFFKWRLSPESRYAESPVNAARHTR